jgi:multiple sugar transport system permease protein
VRMTGMAQPAESAHAQIRERPQHSWRQRTDWTAYLYILPAFAILGVFHLFPVGYALFLSFNRGPINQFQFTGLQNYTQALLNPSLWRAVSNTFAFALLTLPITMALGMLFAYLLFQGVKGQATYRVLFFLPYVISTVGSSIVWAWIFDPANGLANQILGHLGVAPLRWLIEPRGVFVIAFGSLGIQPPTWLQGPSLALVAIAIFTIWQSMGYDIVLFLAGLTNIPGELYEAAEIDGASRLQLFRYITVPLLSPTTFFVLVISVIASLQSFNQIFAMNSAAAQTLGGPLEGTNTLTVYMFNQLYTYSNYGYASTIAILLSILILAFTLINFKFFGKRSEEIARGGVA